MSTFLDKLADYRLNPFTGTFTPNPIGISGNPVEEKTIPSTSPYFVFTDELPRQDSPSSLVVTGPSGTPIYTEVSKTTPPSAGQYRVIYGGDGVNTVGEVGQGMIEFHSSDAGNSIELSYYGLGSILQRQMIFELMKISIPIGSIIAVHPDTKSAYLPDLEYFSPCDGVENLDTTYFSTVNDTKVPDLTDDRFLMGGSSYEAAGTNDRHVHQVSMNYETGSNTLWLFQKGRYPDKDNFTFGETDVSDMAQLLGTGNTGTSSWYGGNIPGNTRELFSTGPVNSSGDLIDNKPLYFSVLYYMRIR